MRWQPLLEVYPWVEAVGVGAECLERAPFEDGPDSLGGEGVIPTDHHIARASSWSSNNLSSS